MKEIIIPIIPMGAVRLTQRSLWSPKARKYAAYKDAIKDQMDGYTLPEELEIEFHLPMPKSWSNKKREASRGGPHKQRPDVDNLCKGFMDAFGVDDFLSSKQCRFSSGYQQRSPVHDRQRGASGLQAGTQ